tara:strand:- start:260 stop:1780 length:1521 start_codon:yes stop_codon:yes gene_type:complete
MKYNEITENFSTYGYVACPPQFTKVGSTQNMYYNAGNLGIKTNNPQADLHITGYSLTDGILGVSGGTLYAKDNNRLQPGSLVIGSITKNYGGSTSGWNDNTACLMLECVDNTEIAVHDNGKRIASLMYYEGPSNTIHIGRNMYWGVTNTRCWGNLSVNGSTKLSSLHIAKTAIDNTIQDQLVLECHNNAGQNGNAILFRNRWNNQNVKWDMARIKAIEQGGYGGQLIFETNHGSGSSDTTTNEAMRIDEWGRIGMSSGSGKFEPQFNVHIGGYVGSKNAPLYAYHHSSNSWSHHGGTTWNTSGHNIGLCVDNRIIAAGMYIMSDYRIKKEIKEINEDESLNIIRKIKPKRYKLKETDKICYGFIAQEIDQIVPDIVSKCKNYISDIMIIAKVEKIDNTSKLNTNVNHTLNKDDIIRCKNSNDTNIDNIKVLEVIDDNTVIIDKIFSDSTIIICGRLVDDYHSIDHDMIMTLGISTIKKLDSEVTKLKEIIEKQQEQIELLIKSIKK